MHGGRLTRVKQIGNVKVVDTELARAWYSAEMSSDSSLPPLSSEHALNEAMEAGLIESMDFTSPDQLFPISFDKIVTPALCVDLDALDRNEAAFEKLLREIPRARAGNITARPHIKSHKCPYLASRQLKSSVVRGMSCATVVEACVMIEEAGARDVLVTNEVLSNAKIRVLVDLCRRYGNETKDCSAPTIEPQFLTLRVCVDSKEGLKILAKAATDHGVTIGVVVEQNVGQDRCGVATAEEVVTLAKLAASDKLKGVAFSGVQGYHGACQHERSATARAAASAAVASKLRETVAALRKVGLKCALVTGGGTGTFLADAREGVLNEVQPGSYLFMDADYGRNEEGFENFVPALFVLSSVISVAKNGQRRAVLDAGLKSHSVESGLPSLTQEWAEHLEVRNGGDEHMILFPVQGKKKVKLPELDSRVLLIPGHVDPTFAMHRFVYFFRDNRVYFRAPVRNQLDLASAQCPSAPCSRTPAAANVMNKEEIASILRKRPRRGNASRTYFNEGKPKEIRLDARQKHSAVKIGTRISYPTNSPPRKVAVQLSCLLCKSQATYKCSVCEVPLHNSIVNGQQTSCFTKFHTFQELKYP